LEVISPVQSRHGPPVNRNDKLTYKTSCDDLWFFLSVLLRKLSFASWKE